MKKILSYLLIAGASYAGYSQCTPITAPFLETFQGNSVPTCWVASGNTAWRYQSPTGGFAAYGAQNCGEHTGTPGSWAIGQDGSLNSNADISYLTTPDINIASLAYPALSYWVFSNNTTQACNNEVRVDVWNGTAWINEETYAQNFGSSYVQRVVSLTAYTGIIKIRFTIDAMVTTCGSAFYNDILFDDVGVIDCTPTTNTIAANSCGYYTAPSGKQLHSAGTYQDTIANSVGCDSLITINLTTSNTTSNINISNICGTYTMPSGLVVGQDGAYTDTSLNAAGCDSVIFYNLTFSNSTSAFSAADCNSYTAPSGAVFTLSGTYSDTIANAAGCDSVMTISLEMSYDNSLTIFPATCGEPYVSDAGITYTVTGYYQENYSSVISGCDSIVYIDLIVTEGLAEAFTIDACDEWTSPAGILYASSGVYIEEYTAENGCDSVITYTVNISTVDNVANWIGAMTIEANETGATYQWVDCNNSNAIVVGATSKVFDVFAAGLGNGDYACMVTKNGCTEMTNCVRVQSLGLEENGTLFSIYPNPSNGVFAIEMPEVTPNTTVTVSNVAGQIIYSSATSETLLNIDLSDVEAGMYFVSVTNENGTAEKAVVIK